MNTWPVDYRRAHLAADVDTDYRHLAATLAAILAVCTVGPDSPAWPRPGHSHGHSGVF